MTQTGDDQQSGEPPRRGRVATVARDAPALAAAAFARKGFPDPSLVLRWEEIVGAEVARLARPLKLNEGPNGGILTLKAEPGASLFLSHETRALCARINAYLGREAVTKLRFVQGPLVLRPLRRAPPRPAAAVPKKDPSLAFRGAQGLRDALASLARWRGRDPDAD
ncbi:MAG: DUF721 domain-containing protein [Pseudomonadota bacterium]|nr:DUF721 domain-containing protein [Pseudomonadota bacterium]